MQTLRTCQHHGVSETGTRSARGVLPLLLSSTVVVLVSFGLARGLWLSNLHNALLALSFVFVGSYVLFQRPQHTVGRLFLVTGVLTALLFLGRQIGHSPTSAGDRWWGWLGVWPIAVAIALATMSVLCFPDGRLPSRRWRWVAAGIVVLAGACAALSALWPVEYASSGVVTAHPLHAASPAAASAAWSAMAHPLYAALQVLWVVAIAVRWRSATPRVRRQLAWLVSAAALSVLALLIGLMAAGSPRAGLLAATLVPLAAGWTIVHGQHATAYSALSWLSRADADSAGLPTDLAQAVAEALSAPGATLWIGSDKLHAVGVWPECNAAIAPTTLAALQHSGDWQTRVVTRRSAAVGALTVQRPAIDALSLAESRLFDDLASQGALVIDHLGLADVIARQRQAGHLDGLSPRERDVLELMARGRSNAAVCSELHLSIKTVEPIVSTIFSKLGLHADAASNRRVLAVLAYVRN